MRSTERPAVKDETTAGRRTRRTVADDGGHAPPAVRDGSRTAGTGDGVDPGTDRTRPAGPPRPQAGDDARSSLAGFTTVLALVVALLLVVPPVVAYQVADDRPTIWGARSELVFLGGSTQSPQRAEQQLRTQTVLLGSRAFLSPTAGEFDVPVDELREEVTVEQLEDSEVLQVTVTDPDPDRARRLASSIVDTYVGNVGVLENSEEEQQLLAERIAELEQEQEQVDIRLAELAAQRAQQAVGVPNPVTPEQLRLESRARSLSDQLSDLQAQVVDLRIADLQEEAAVSVLTPAYVMPEPVAPQPLRAAAAGLLVGVLLAGTVVVLGLRLRRTR